MNGRRASWLATVFGLSVVGVLVVLAPAAYWYFQWPVTSLRRGLERYLAPPHGEPIDDKDNMARMEGSVRSIRERRLYHATDVLLDVWLQYDATDNPVSQGARDTLSSFGEPALPAIEARMRMGSDGSRAGWLAGLRLEIWNQSPLLHPELPAQNERAAVDTLREIASHLGSFRIDTGRYPTNLSELAGGQYHLIDPELARSGSKWGYCYCISNQPRGSSRTCPAEYWELSALPVEYATTGRRVFVMKAQSSWVVYGKDLGASSSGHETFPEDPSASGWEEAK